MNTTPRRVHCWAIRIAIAGTVGTFATLSAWAFELIPTTRPNLVLMVYILTLSAGVGGVMVGAAAACHMAVGRAFGAGLSAGHTMATRPPAGDDGPSLRLVE